MITVMGDDGKTLTAKICGKGLDIQVVDDK